MTTNGSSGRAESLLTQQLRVAAVAYELVVLEQVDPEGPGEVRGEQAALAGLPRAPKEEGLAAGAGQGQGKRGMRLRLS